MNERQKVTAAELLADFKQRYRNPQLFRYADRPSAETVLLGDPNRPTSFIWIGADGDFGFGFTPEQRSRKLVPLAGPKTKPILFIAPQTGANRKDATR